MHGGGSLWGTLGSEGFLGLGLRAGASTANPCAGRCGVSGVAGIRGDVTQTPTKAACCFGGMCVAVRTASLRLPAWTCIEDPGRAMGVLRDIGDMRKRKRAVQEESYIESLV